MRYLVIGGTGTLGTAIISRLTAINELEDPVSPGVGKYDEIICFSRDELKQQQLKAKHPRTKCIIGDVRDKDAVGMAMRGVDVVFHVAALKHIDVVESHPIEGLKTNILGTINVAEQAIANGVSNVVFSSTDKAVLPVNTYGITKAFCERYLFQKNVEQDIVKFSVFRWGNVFGSRGSVIHAFLKSLKEKATINITDTKMTRFWIDIHHAANFMIENYRYALPDHPMIPPMKAAPLMKIAAACAHKLGINNYSVNTIGIRNGEKIHECIHSSHDECIRSDNSVEFDDEEILEMVERLDD